MSSARRQLGRILLGVALVKALLLGFDSRPRLFLGDSMSSLHTAAHGWIPADRSFVYGFFLRPVAVWPHSLHVMVWVQTTLSALSSWLAALCLIRYCKAPFWVAAAFSLLCAIEPLQLYAERFVMLRFLQRSSSPFSLRCALSI